MDFIDIIKSRRSIRRFDQQEISKETLLNLVDSARLAPSAANLQPLEYIIINEKTILDLVFDQLAWAGYIRPKRNPSEDKKPVAYIAVLRNSSSNEKFSIVDAAAAIENILIAAWSINIGSCWIGNINRDNLHKVLNIPDDYVIDSVIALGYPAENPVLEEINDDSIKYYLDENDRLHVPKKALQKITHINAFGSKLID